MKDLLLSVVIPCYNEEKNIKIGALDSMAGYLEKQKYSWEAVLVDDGSGDQSAVLINNFIKEHPNFSLIKNPHQGKAGTVITGVLSARGQYVLFADLDQATPINQIEKLLPWLEKNYEIAIGSRNSIREGAPFSRILMAKGFIFLRTLILGLKKISDTQCGFKAFEKRAANHLFSKLQLYSQKKIGHGSMVTAGFDIEILFLAKKMGYKIKEVPVEWHYVETRRVNPLKDSWQGFWDLVKIRLNDLRGKYD